MSLNAVENWLASHDGLPKSTEGEREGGVVRFSLGKNTFDNKPEQKEVASFEEFQEIVLSSQSTKKGELYICAPLKVSSHENPDKYPGEYPWRSANNCLPKNWISFDFDGFQSANKAKEVFDFLSQFRGFGYYTASSTREAPRARVILALNREADRATCKSICSFIQHQIQDKFGMDAVKFDDSVYKGEQPCYTPIKDGKHFVLSGAAFDISSVPETKREIRFDSLTSLSSKNTHEEYSPSSANVIADNCAQIKFFRDNKGDNMTEPQWRSCLGVIKHTVEGEALAHEWSKGDSRYDASETQEKLNRWKTGPTSCKEFQLCSPALCKPCSYLGKLSSPIVLGFDDKKLETPDAVISFLNSKYFVSHENGKAEIFGERYEHELKRMELYSIPQRSFALEWGNRNITYTVPSVDSKGNAVDREKTVKWPDLWLNSPKRRQYLGGIALLPGEKSPSNVYNLWRGFGVDATQGNVTLIIDHINLICGNQADYVIKWFAWGVQNLGKKSEVALVFRGGRGTGKGTLLRLQRDIFGIHALQISSAKHFTGNFNAHLRAVLFLFVDEGYWAGDKAAEGTLKALITEDMMVIERKGVDATAVRNRLNVVMASNSDWVVPAGIDERRFCVVEVPDSLRGDHAYFEKLNTFLCQGGKEAWLHYLLNLDLSGFNIRNVPYSSALETQKLLSLEPFLAFIYSALDESGFTEEGRFYSWDDNNLQHAKMKIHNAAVEYLRKNHYRAIDAGLFGKKMRELFPSLTDTRINNVRYWGLPPLALARAQFELHAGLSFVKWS
jgi:hypothetical protein